MNSIPKPEFPRPERSRDSWMNLNGEWDFHLFAEGQEADEKLFAESRDNRYDCKINVPFSWVCPLSGVQENVPGIGWYAKDVAFLADGRIFLCFGAVDYLASVYVNGTFAGSHQGGYSYFEIDVTALWYSGENRIEVRCEDYRRDTQLYGKQGYGEIQGIWQTVWLESRPNQYIKDFRITTKLDGEVTICVEAEAENDAVITADFGDICGEGKIQNGKATLILKTENPHLWSVDDPYLYEGTLALGDDKVHTYFGIRTISTGKIGNRDYKWILLNGKPIYLNGTLDQAFNPKGHFTYPSDADMYAEAWRLKRLGLNMVRIHIKPEEPRKLYWMDKLGILVMADIPCFWGAPVEEARTAYEREMVEIMHRDLNHPSIFAWVVFNETWGLMNKNENGEKVYLPETQDWVLSIWKKAKSIDPERLVEDNSPCNHDHVATDLNTWHFYKNSYPVVRDHIREVVNKTYPGSEYNFIGGRHQDDAPLMNSECGMVWGVDESAGDSDIAWNYHYMLNEYRLHEKLCGFIFTEFHDVVNEFNGYYRIDDTDKDFGYQDFCRGMRVSDMHADDFVAVDCAPVQSVSAGETIEVPMVLSSFSDARHGMACTLEWKLWHDGLNGRVTDHRGTVALPAFDWGTTVLPALKLTMPAENALEVLSLYLKDVDGKVVSRNFTTFDVSAALPKNMIEIPVCDGKAEGFAPVWHALQDDKLCMGGKGQVSYAISTGNRSVNDMIIHMEAGSKRVLKKDCNELGEPEKDMGFMRGYLVDRGAFKNSYWMTDESRFTSGIEVLVNGNVIYTHVLENDWADARGVLSWEYQSNHRKLDEAGSYGEDIHITVPSNLLPQIQKDDGFTLTIRTQDKGGLALYGRHSGRYAHGLLVEML